MSATRGHFHFRRRTFRKASVFGKRAPFLRRAEIALFGGEVSWSDMWQCNGSNNGCRLCSRKAPLCSSELQRSELTRTVGQTREV